MRKKTTTRPAGVEASAVLGFGGRNLNAGGRADRMAEVNDPLDQLLDIDLTAFILAQLISVERQGVVLPNEWRAQLFTVGYLDSLITVALEQLKRMPWISL